MGLSVVTATCLALVQGELPEGTSWQWVSVNSEERRYLVHVPAESGEGDSRPVILCFHGGGSNPEQMMGYCGLNEKADEEGFLVVYPEGSGRLEAVRTWNAGNCCGYAQRRKVDDVAFVRALLDDLQERADIDADRVFATGISNGAMISYRLASELSDRIAAIAPIAGPMGFEECSPEHPVSVIHFHGTDDEFAAFGGGPGKRSVSRTDFYSVRHTIDAWVAANQCDPEPVTAELPDRADDGMTVRSEIYSSRESGAEVALYVIEGGGHTWPGRIPRASRFLGPSTRDISANDLMWAFFQRHPRQTSESSGGRGQRR